MKLDKNHISSGIVGAIVGACSVMGINALSDNNNVITSFFDSTSHRGKGSLFDRVEADADGDVFITTKGRKYHSGDCYILRQSDEIKQATLSDVIDVGYKPCKKCKP